MILYRNKRINNPFVFLKLSFISKVILMKEKENKNAENQGILEYGKKKEPPKIL